MYRGRFAPSPTGDLHFGSLLAATASYLEARSRQGQWLLRMEDIDPPREVPGAAGRILRALEAYGFAWDGEVLYQSRRDEAYRAALERLIADGHIYACRCSRREALEDSAAAGLAPGVYAGRCREARLPLSAHAALRVCTKGALIEFTDGIHGIQKQNLEREIGDFIVRRADGLWAYQLAVVVDDAAQDISDVVRGCDLLDSTPRQIHLQHLLGLPTLRYLHLPIALNAAGEKLSKQTYAQPLPLDDPRPLLYRALKFLGQNPPPDLPHAPLAELWQWAMKHWTAAAIPRVRALPASALSD